MSVQWHLATLEPADLAEVYRHWAGEIGVPTSDEALVRGELARLMTDQDRVLLRFRGLPGPCRDFLEWLVCQDGYAVPMSRLDEEGAGLPVKPFEVDAVAFALKKRGFVLEMRDRSWMHFNEPVYRIPRELGEVLSSLLQRGERSLESQLTLTAFLRTLPRAELEARAEARGVPSEFLDDRAALVDKLSDPDAVKRAIDALGDTGIEEAASRLVNDLGGVADAKHLERLGHRVDAGEWGERLEAALLGIVLRADLTDVGLQLGPGGVVLFLDVMARILESRLDVEPEEAPEPPADVLADIAASRTFLDHHSVRVTREGTLYRATQRKMVTEVLSPGARIVEAEDALDFIQRFLTDAGLAAADHDGKLRTTAAWDDYERRAPVERTELLLTWVLNDVRGVKSGFHQQRLRKMLLSALEEFGAGRWLRIRPLAALVRNRYLGTLDHRAAAERFQKRYKYATLPTLAGPSLLTRELIEFIARGLSLCGLVEVYSVEEQPVAVRLTRLGAAALGLPEAASSETASGGALIVTADFEVVLFPEAGGIDLVHEISRFARREKADYSFHYRILERTVQQAVIAGMDADAILGVLARHGRHDVPQNVEVSVRRWAAGVLVLNVARTLLLRAPSKKSLDAALKLRELKAIALERLNDTTVELKEDPSSARVAEALRSEGFFLR